MDILDILLDILLKPPQPFIGLFLYYFVGKGKLISVKSLPPVEIEPATLRP